MPNPVQAPQGTEQKLVFRTEEERQKALDAIPMEPPAGTSDIDSWRRNQDSEQDKIETAAIDPNYSPGQPQTPAGPARSDQPATAPQQGGDWYKPEDWTVQQNGQTITIGRDEIPEELRSKGIKNAKDLILDHVSTVRYSETKNREYQQSLSEMQRQMSDMNKKISDYEKQLAESKKHPETPAPQRPDLPGEQEINTLQAELKTINDQLENVEDDLSPEALALQRKAIRLTNQLHGMERKVYDARFQAMDQEREQFRKQAQEEQERKQRDEAARKVEEQAREKKATMAKMIEKFSTTVDPKLKLSKSFEEVEKEYADWAVDIAATYFNLPPNQVHANHAEIAVHNFLNRTPAFITKLTEQGKLNKTPADLRKYLINTELYFMMQGQELDPVSGEWKQNEWRLPDMETAYERWKRKKGLKYQNEVDAANKAEEELLRVMNPPNLAEQVPANQGPQAQRDMSKVSLPQAETIMHDLEKKASLAGYGDLEEWIEVKRRRNMGDEDVMLYDKADEALFDVKEK